MKRITLSTVAATLAAAKAVKPAPDVLAKLVRDTTGNYVRLPTAELRKAGFKASADAANAVADAGGSPREQLDAARAHADGKRLNYLPHQGAKERAKRMKRNG